MLGAPRLVESGVGRDRDEGVERWVELVDARQAIAGEFNGRDGAVANLPAELLNRGTHGILDRPKRFYRLWAHFIRPIVGRVDLYAVTLSAVEGPTPSYASRAKNQSPARRLCADSQRKTRIRMKTGSLKLEQLAFDFEAAAVTAK